MFYPKKPKKSGGRTYFGSICEIHEIGQNGHFGWKLKIFKNFFFSKLALIYDYYMVIIPNFAQTNPSAAIGANCQNSWFPRISDFQQTPTHAAMSLTPDPNRWWFWDHHRWGFYTSKQTGISWNHGWPVIRIVRSQYS